MPPTARPIPMPATASASRREEVNASAMVADPLRLLHVCATSDGGAARRALEPGVCAAPRRARRRGSRRSPPSRRALRATKWRCRTSRPIPRRLPSRRTPSAASIASARLRGGRASGREELSLAEVYDLAASLELDWYEYLGLCQAGGAETLLRSGATRGGRAHSGEPERRAGLLRGGRARAGARAGVRTRLADARGGRRAAGRERAGRHHGEPGPLRPRLSRAS